MRTVPALIVLIVLALPAAAGATTLNKCIDVQGRITYSNLPCRNAKEARTVEIDPAPPAPAPAPPADRQPRRAVAQPAAAPPSHEAKASSPPAARASMRQCDTLSDKLGRVSDKMDQARRKGYTQKQMDAWNLEVKELERKKQQAGCF